MKFGIFHKQIMWILRRELKSTFNKSEISQVQVPIVDIDKYTINTEIHWLFNLKIKYNKKSGFLVYSESK